MWRRFTRDDSHNVTAAEDNGNSCAEVRGSCDYVSLHLRPLCLVSQGGVSPSWQLTDRLTVEEGSDASLCLGGNPRRKKEKKIRKNLIKLIVFLRLIHYEWSLKENISSRGSAVLQTTSVCSNRFGWKKKKFVEYIKESLSFI